MDKYKLEGFYLHMDHNFGFQLLILKGFLEQFMSLLYIFILFIYI
jgi:hypothetical protein